MEAFEDNQYVLFPTEYKEAIKSNKNFYIQFHFFTAEIESIFMRIIHRFLENHDILYLKEMILTIIRELITNAVKANTKRLYFKLKNYDISNTSDYRKGMETFKNDVYVEQSDIFEKLKKVKLAVRVSFKALPDKLVIEVTNNTQILKEEMSKIEARIKKAYTYANIADALSDVMDDSEGAGLGLIMALMLFKNAGFPNDSFKIHSGLGLTTTTLTIPLTKERYRFNIKIAEELIKEVETIPSFPENLLEIQRLSSNPDSTMHQISESIKRDPGLTTNLLKLANSAGYITVKKTKTIEDAVKLVGLKLINTLLLAHGVQKIMSSRYKKFENVWQNSYRAAFYAQKIGMQVKRNNLTDFVYLAALLADIGQIVLLSVKPEITQKIHEIAGTKIIEQASLLEEMSLGVSHSTLGSLICEKWKFHDALIKIVEFHERPHHSPQQYKGIIYIVYLAYALVDIETRKQRFEFLDEDVLDFFNLNNKDRFELLHKALKAAYDSQRQ